MGINIAINETQCANALCGKFKKNILSVLVDDPLKYGDAAEYEIFIPIEDALSHFSDKEDFIKRNKIREETTILYLDRLKDDNDRKLLEKVVERTYTGWVNVSKVNDDMKDELLSSSSTSEGVQTEWDMFSFEEMGDICGRCKLSWDKGRGCVGSFGPDNGNLPEIASKAGCKMTASVPDGVSSKRVYTKEDALLLLNEIPILRNALEKESKLAVRRYSGTVERLEAVAKISIEEGCGFRFF
ncbi:MAG: hypothetical protein FWD37_01740 [Methanomassiliicoccaceae archaeon]|nr:hypothetical protein [Methanomassiliicoccaceae archaeon]